MIVEEKHKNWVRHVLAFIAGIGVFVVLTSSVQFVTIIIVAFSLPVISGHINGDFIEIVGWVLGLYFGFRVYQAIKK